MSGAPPEADAPVARVLVPERVLTRVRTRALASHPEECCGLLVGVRAGGAVRVRRELACPNVAPREDRQRRFLVEPRAVVEAIRTLRGSPEALVGIYHSHPDGGAALSATDLEFVALWPETVWLVVPVGGKGEGGERAWWLPRAAGSAETPRELALEVLPPEGGAWREKHRETGGESRVAR